MAEQPVGSEEDPDYFSYRHRILQPDSDSNSEAGTPEEFIPVLDSDSPRVSTNSGQATSLYVLEERDKRRRVEKLGGDMCCSNGDEGGSQESQWNRAEIDSLSCPICMEAWTNEGDHQICCLPCGHLFGLSCINKWLRQTGRSAKCPQCNRKCVLKDVRKLFAPRIAVFDEESQKRIRSLEAKCASLEKKGCDWHKKESEWQKLRAALQLKINKLSERTTYLEHLLGDLQSRPSGLVSASRGYQGQSVSGNIANSKFYSQGPSSSFVLQTELRVDGARLFDIDASGLYLLLARRVPRMGGSPVLTKMSLIPPHETEDIFLSSSTKSIKDLHISPFNRGLALCASLGKKLSVFSVQSNNVILSYDLPAAAWSCSWDLNCSHYVYAGLQSGLLLVFDMRQTARPIESRLGLTTNPIHTIHSLQHRSTLPSGVRTVVSASSIGVCQWNFDDAEERPYLIPETENQGVCISLASCGSSDDIVASYRPRVEMSNEIGVSQPLFTPSPGIGQGIMGSYLHLKKIGTNYQKSGIACATVSGVRLPKSTIIDMDDQKPLFATGDEVTYGLILQELPSFTVAQRLKSHNHFICDVKYTSTLGQGLLSCLSEDTLQLFNTKIP